MHNHFISTDIIFIITQLLIKKMLVYMVFVVPVKTLTLQLFIFLSKIFNGEKYCYLVVAKTKVGPIKNVSIPKLELVACVLLTNLIRYVISSM